MPSTKPNAMRPHPSFALSVLLAYSGCQFVAGLDDPLGGTTPLGAGASLPDGSTGGTQSGGTGATPDASGGDGADGDAGRPETGDTGTGGTGGTSTGGGGSGGTQTPVGIELHIAEDVDDAMWNHTHTVPRELLYYSDSDIAIYVGTDADDQTLGLRFALDVPKGATVLWALLDARVAYSTFKPSDSLEIRVWDSSDVPPFSDTHTHSPFAHDPNGLWARSVGGWKGLSPSKLSTSPDLVVLVQHVVNRSDWHAGGHIGFFVSPSVGTTPDVFTGFVDSSKAISSGAKLRMLYVPP